MLLIAAVGVADVVATPVLALAAVGLLALLLRARPRVWIADQVVTDQRVVVAPRDLPARWLERDELASVELVGTRAIFTARDGEELRFGHVSRPGRLFKRVRAGLPEVDADRRPDLGLPDLRHPLVAAPCARPVSPPAPPPPARCGRCARWPAAPRRRRSPGARPRRGP